MNHRRGLGGTTRYSSLSPSSFAATGALLLAFAVPTALLVPTFHLVVRPCYRTRMRNNRFEIIYLTPGKAPAKRASGWNMMRLCHVPLRFGWRHDKPCACEELPGSPGRVSLYNASLAMPLLNCAKQQWNGASCGNESRHGDG